MDFMAGQLFDGRPFRVPTVLDVHTREALSAIPRASFRAAQVVEVLDQLVRPRGKPKSLRVDNGPEFAGRLLDHWASLNGVEIDFPRANAIRDVAGVEAGERVLVNGAGGGLGIHGVQVAHLSGAEVIAATSSARKADMIRRAGADHAVVYERGEDFSAKVKAITDGEGVDVAVDNVGSATFDAMRRSLARRGRWIFIGQLSGDFVRLNPVQLFLRGLSIHGAQSTNRRQLVGCLELVRRGLALIEPGTPKLGDVPTPGIDVAVEISNDGKCDRRGRFWTGTMDREVKKPGGALYRVDPDPRVHRMATGITLANGIARSPDDRTMYFRDSRPGTIRAWNYDLDSGSIENKRLFVGFDARKGQPDRCTVDAEGGLWVAEIGAGQVARFDPAGKEVSAVKMPVSRPTSVMFGGPDLRTLFVTSMQHGLSPEETAAESGAGCVFATSVGVAGLPEPRFAGYAGMRIGIVGAGFIGRAVATLAVQTGHEVMIGNSRDPRTLGSTVVAIGCSAGTVEQAASFGDAALIAIPFHAIHDLPAAPFSGKPVLDANNYDPERDGPVAALDKHETTTSGMLAAHLGTALVVKAFNAILQQDLAEGGTPPGSPGRRALPIAGDDSGAKHVAAGLHDQFGYDVVDAGPLAEGWRFERAMPACCVPFDRAALVAALAGAERGVEVPHGSWRRS